MSNILTNILEEISSSDSDKIVKYISENMQGKTFHHHYHLLYDIRSILGTEKKIYTEIGTYCGGSTSLMLQHNYETEINCIDPFNVLPNQKAIVSNNIKKFNKHNYKCNVYPVYSTNYAFFNYLKSIQFKTDILFIDGDHSKKGVIFDFENYKDFVNPGGFIVFDDYEDYMYSPEVKIAVNTIVSNIDRTKYNIIGNFKKIKNVNDNGIPMNFYNEYIIQKI